MNRKETLQEHTGADMLAGLLRELGSEVGVGWQVARQACQINTTSKRSVGKQEQEQTRAPDKRVRGPVSLPASCAP